MAAPHPKRPKSGDTGLKGRHACVRQIFPFSFIRTVTVGFGIAPNLLTPPIARRALAGFGDCSPSPPVGTFTPPRERGRTEIRPIRFTHFSPSMQRFLPTPWACSGVSARLSHRIRLIRSVLRGALAGTLPLSQTLLWREVDSNFPFRAANQHRTAPRPL